MRFTVDDRARPLALEPGARRIVSLAPACTESLLAIGAGERLVGVDEHSELPAALAAMPRVGGFKDVDVERLVALAPDLVVGASLHAVVTASALEARGLRVFVMAARTVNGVVDGMARLTAVIGVARQAAPYLAACRARVDAVVEATLRARQRPLVYVEYSPIGHSGGPQSFLDDLVSKAGGLNLGGVARVEWPILPAVTVRRFDPDVIVIARYPGSATAGSLAARAGWEGVRAVRCRRVHELPAGLVKRPGPGVLDGLERLAGIVADARGDLAGYRPGSKGVGAPAVR
jgi:iron complex transport system substrate-binding protein